MVTQAPAKTCLVYLPHSYTGRGPAESCVQVIRYFEGQGLHPVLFVGRVRHDIPSGIEVRSGLPGAFNLIPWRIARIWALKRLDCMFERALAEKTTPGIAYFWPSPPPGLVRRARERGWLTVREMTNRTLAAAKASLDEAFARAGESAPHHISEPMAQAEAEELRAFDLVFASNCPNE